MRKITQIKISLTEHQFRQIISGQTVTISHSCSAVPINISIKDIGMGKIVEIVMEARKNMS